MAPPGVYSTTNTIMTLYGLSTSPSHVYGETPFSRIHENDHACFSLMDPDRTYSLEGLWKTDFLTRASQSKIVGPKK